MRLLSVEHGGHVESVALDGFEVAAVAALNLMCPHVPSLRCLLDIQLTVVR